MITESKQAKRLNSLGINIKTFFYDNGKKKQRNTDNSLNQDIKQGIIIEKDYYKHGNLLRKEKSFDSRISYTYEFSGEDKYTCKNCGMEGEVKDFTDGCPYCHTNYNIDYDNKELSNKKYYDLIIKDKSYIIKTFFLDIVFSLLLVGIYIYNTSRTFYTFDIIKIIVIGFFISLVLFFIFYYLDALIILPWLRKKKEKSNQKQVEFWNRMQKYFISKTKFYNNLNYELRNLFYSDKYKDVVDYDILDYNSLKEKEEDDKLFVTINIDIRIIRLVNNKIESKIETKEFLLKRVESKLELTKKVNFIPCPNCGASIDATTEVCEYCGTPHNYLQEWYLQEL